MNYSKSSLLRWKQNYSAVMLLLNRNLRQELIALVENVEVVELAANPAFDRAFMKAMKF